jgi:hypothetical protein
MEKILRLTGGKLEGQLIKLDAYMDSEVSWGHIVILVVVAAITVVSVVTMVIKHAS